MPDEPRPDASLPEPVREGDTLPAAATAPPAKPQSAAPAPRPPASEPPKAAQPAPEPKPEPPAEPRPELVTIKYEGQEFQLPKEAAEAWQRRQEAFDRGFKTVKDELDAIRASMPQPPKPATPSEEEIREQLATRLLTEPDKVFAEWKDQMRKELTEEYQADVRTREFQAKFWGDNHEILPYREVFDGLLMKNAGSYIKEGLTDQQAYERTADAVRKMILSIKGNGQPAANPADQHVEEPGPSGGPAAVTEPADEGVSRSLTEAIKRRQNQKNPVLAGAR